MLTAFEKASIPGQIRSLMDFDARCFPLADRFDAPAWRECEPWWMRLGRRRIGCCGFQEHVDFQEDLRSDRSNPRRESSLYIVTTAILPEYQRMGFGTLMKSWQICYARVHGFRRIVTNTRKENRGMIALNEKLGFKILRIGPAYYSAPVESTVVMELNLKASR